MLPFQATVPDISQMVGAETILIFPTTAPPHFNEVDLS
jgi:hypothetical protein